MRRFLLIPVWFLMLCIKPFLPFTHPWRSQRCTLQWWVDGATDDNVLFGAVFWIHGYLFIWWLWLFHDVL